MNAGDAEQRGRTRPIGWSYGALCVCALGVLVACRSSEERANSSETKPASSVSNGSVAALGTPGAAGADGATLRFIENDYAAALARAKAEGLPLFVDAWAPWCHTCLSMKEYVFNAPVLSSLVPKFIWAAIDTEREESAAFLKQFKMQAWPTLWVIDPDTEEPRLKWLGSVTATELVTLLESTVTGNVAQQPELVAATTAWLRANREAAAGRRESAVLEFYKALGSSSAAWVVRPRVVEALLQQLEALERHPECAVLASHEWPTLPRGTSRLNVVSSGLECALAVNANPEAPNRSTSAALISTLTREVERMLADAAEPILADDKSSLFERIVALNRERGDATKAKAWALRWAQFLEAEAASAPSNEARAVFDSHRVLAYSAAALTEKAVPMLEQSERDFPNDYNPSTRLAKVNLELARLDLALAAIQRAQSKVYGPRALRVLWLKADILLAMKQPKEAKRVLLEGIALGEKLDLSDGYQRLLGELRKRHESL